MSNKRITFINMIFSLLLQVVTIISGFILPRIIIASFGSKLNGMVSSIGQFLSFINLLEGGLGGVILAAYYKPLYNNDFEKVSGVYKAAKGFYRQIGIIYTIYAIVIGIVYPIFVDTGYSWSFVFVLTLVISFNTFVQYCFSVSLRTLINADRKGYIISIVSIIIIVCNLIITLIVIKWYNNIIVLKAFSAILFLLQPIVFGLYVKKHYSLNKDAKKDEKCLKQRWAGLGQNIAYFIHSNTDIVLITIFSTLSNVSVYNVYMMVVIALRNLVTSISKAINPSMGNILAGNDEQSKNDFFDKYEVSMNLIATFVFSCGAILITPFVGVYTNGITDASYYQPILGMFLMLAEGIYCLREPYVSVAYSKGRFRETAIYAYVEAGMNIVISIILYHYIGLPGIAIGTFIAMLYRAITHIIYLKKHILYRPLKTGIKRYFQSFCAFIVSFVLISFIEINVVTYFQWFIYALIVSSIVVTVIVIIWFIFDNKVLTKLYKSVIIHKKK